MKNLIFLAYVILSIQANNAHCETDNSEDTFSSGETSREVTGSGENETRKGDSTLSCFETMCTLITKKKKLKKFNFHFNFGQGSENSRNTSNERTTNIYLGDNGTSDSDGLSFGFNINYVRGECEESIIVPSIIYRTIHDFFEGLRRLEGRRYFNPSEERIIKLFENLSSLLKGCEI